MGREERQDRVSAARRRAEQHTSGYETTVLKVPEGVGFFELKAGTHRIDVVPYKVVKGKEVRGGNPFADKGELYYERTFWAYRRIGPDEKSYVALGKTFGKPDPIQEYRQAKAKDPDADRDSLKAFDPKERQIFLLYDRDEPGKGIQLLEISYHTFGKLLDSRIKNSTEDEGWDLFYFPGTDGMTLRLTVEEQTAGGYKFLEVTAIDFVPRKEGLPDKIKNHGIDLDEMLVEVPYQKMKDLFLGVETDKTSNHAVGKQSEVKDEKKKETEKKPEPEKKKGPPTASDFGLKAGDDVVYRKQKCTIFKISPDGTSLTLMTADDDPIKAIGPDEVVPWKEAEVGNDKSDKEPAAEQATESADASDGESRWDKDWDE